MEDATENERNRRHRRRPRPFDSRRDDDDGIERGDSDGLLAKTLENALSLTRKDQIDSILEQRERDGPPRPEGADACPTYEYVDEGDGNDEPEGGLNNAAGAAAEDEDEEGGRRGRVRRVEVLPMTDHELAEARADVFGRPPPDVARTEERLLALEIEVGKLPKSERRALDRALQKIPLLFVNCPHTKLMVEQDEEDFDAAAAARRLARYWDCRRALLGDEAYCAPGVLPETTLAGYQKYYARLRAVSEDPRTDEMARQDAESLLRVIDEGKIEALDAILLEMEQDFEEDIYLEEHNDSAVAAAFLKTSAHGMAMETPDELKLQFLRVEDMDEEKAARRLVSYWETGLRLFGPKLMQTKHASLDDMEDCSELLRCNQLRVMPEEDDFGRTVLVYRQIISSGGEDGIGDVLSEEEMSRQGINEDHHAKMAWYFLHAALERESCRCNGYVCIVDVRNWIANFKMYQAFVNVRRSMPIELRAYHVLLGRELPWWQQHLLNFTSFVMVGISLRRKILRKIFIHDGAIEQIVSRLGDKFGIGLEKLPSDLGGTVEASYFAGWIEERRAAGL